MPRNARRMSTFRGTALLSMLVSGCTAPDFGSCPVGQSRVGGESCVATQVEYSLDLGDRRDVDILFVIDNSPSMTPKQLKLAENIPRFIQAIEAKNLNYHVGIVTTDVGTLPASGRPFPTSAGSCDTAKGDDGLLQNLPCTERSLSPAAQQACQTLCQDPRFVPQNGQRFISKQAGISNVPVAMMLDPKTGKLVDRGPENAFKCMALVGDRGCGVESPLEAARRALAEHPTENANFLRANSTLALIFVTDEDDCSVQLAMRDTFGNPASRDCGPGATDPECFRIDYRCVTDSIECDQPLSSEGPKTNCHPKPSKYLESVSKYVNYFSSLNRGNVVVGGIWTLPSTSSGGKVQIVASRAGTDGLSLATDQNAACVYGKDPTIVGQAQSRLSQFADRFATQVQVSVCDIDNYPTALDKIGAAIAPRKPICISSALKTEAGVPNCIVGDVDYGNPTASVDSPFPVCSSGCCTAMGASATGLPEEPSVVAACAQETAAACYCVVPTAPSASSCNGQWMGSVWRKGGAAQPQDKVVSVRCAVQ